MMHLFVIPKHRIKCTVRKLTTIKIFLDVIGRKSCAKEDPVIRTRLHLIYLSKYH
jgi:hypothetical protein